MSHHPSGSTGTRNLFLSEDALKSPKTGHLFLHKSLVGNGSSTSINEMAPPATPHTPGGIRVQLGHLLPRHAYFRARVVIHQISSVPFVSGEFGVRWKFKGVQTASGTKQGLLGRVKARAEKQRTTSKEEKGKGREGSGDFEAPSEDGHVMVTSPGGGQRPHSERASTNTSLASSLSSRSSQSAYLSIDSTPINGSSNSSLITMVPTPSSAPDLSEIIPANATPARGMTPFLKLKEHSVVWSQTLDTVLKFDIDRETSQIMPNPLKLVVMQRVIPDDPDGSPQNPRLGAVYLNLAEYVGQGSVERRYLLKESKTNATLKVCRKLKMHLLANILAGDNRDGTHQR